MSSAESLRHFQDFSISIFLGKTRKCAFVLIPGEMAPSESKRLNQLQRHRLSVSCSNPLFPFGPQPLCVQAGEKEHMTVLVHWSILLNKPHYHVPSTWENTKEITNRINYVHANKLCACLYWFIIEGKIKSEHERTQNLLCDSVQTWYNRNAGYGRESLSFLPMSSSNFRVCVIIHEMPRRFCVSGVPIKYNSIHSQEGCN